MVRDLLGHQSEETTREISPTEESQINGRMSIDELKAAMRQFQRPPWSQADLRHGQLDRGMAPPSCTREIDNMADADRGFQGAE